MLFCRKTGTRSDTDNNQWFGNTNEKCHTSINKHFSYVRNRTKTRLVQWRVKLITLYRIINMMITMLILFMLLLFHISII